MHRSKVIKIKAIGSGLTLLGFYKSPYHSPFIVGALNVIVNSLYAAFAAVLREDVFFSGLAGLTSSNSTFLRSIPSPFWTI